MAKYFRLILPFVVGLIVACTPRSIAPEQQPQWSPGDTVLNYTAPGDEGQPVWPEPSPHLSFIPSEISFWCSSDNLELCDSRILTITNNTDGPVDVYDAFIAGDEGLFSDETKFMITEFESCTLEVDEEMHIELAFSLSTKLVQATLVVLTTFPDQETVLIPLYGKVFIW